MFFRFPLILSPRLFFLSLGQNITCRNTVFLANDILLKTCTFSKLIVNVVNSFSVILTFSSFRNLLSAGAICFNASLNLLSVILVFSVFIFLFVTSSLFLFTFSFPLVYIFISVSISLFSFPRFVFPSPCISVLLSVFFHLYS
jgi:hypothetical protein